MARRISFSSFIPLLLIMIGNMHTSMHTSKAKVDIAIIGAGPGGLAAALAVKNRLSSATNNATVAVYERDQLEVKGASVTISPSGWENIRRVDPELEERIRRTGVQVTSVDIRNFVTEKKKGLSLPLFLGFNFGNILMRVRTGIIGVINLIRVGLGWKKLPAPVIPCGMMFE